ncbi:peptidoglycan-binding domain-containing protein [Acuticoccus kandeliae]|uniref:peptidoglycan-binding domain-containing protein n=1 Tax=Acuticoccus kandeliae TaxID=2073160 RepID=UPI003CCBE898
MQQYLANIGYSPGPIDGIVGDRTRAAFFAYGRSKGLSEVEAIIDSLFAEFEGDRQSRSVAAAGPSQSVRPLPSQASRLTSRQRDWVLRSCPTTMPSLTISCMNRETQALLQGEPDLSGLQPLDQVWIIDSCPDSLSPSLALSCRRRELSALNGGWPDLTELSSADRAWVVQSCPTSLGPSLTFSCRTRERNALLSNGYPIR